MQIIVVAVLLANEIIHIRKPFRRRNCAAELACQSKNQVDEGAAEGSEIFRRLAGAADGGIALEQERIERHAGAIGLADHRRFVVAVDLMILQLPQVFFGQIRAVQLFELAIHGQAVDGDGIALVELGFLCGDVLAFHVGVGVDFASGRCIERACIAADEILMLLMRLVPVDSHRFLSFLSGL